MAVAGLLLAGCESVGGGLQALRLPACTAEESVFASTEFDRWDDVYHRQVDNVIEEHMERMKRIGTEPMRCTEEDYANRVPASTALRETAGMLPSWEDRLDDLYESDMQAVLLEFLRIYECSMGEHAQFLSVSASGSMTFGELGTKQTEVRATVDRETVLARESLSRALGLVSGFDRLQPLSLDIECLKRSSLDLRNVLGLASDASSCLPRIWDAKGSLRDLTE